MKEYVGRVAELPPGSMAEVSAFGHVYLICNVNGEFYAIGRNLPSSRRSACSWRFA